MVGGISGRHPKGKVIRNILAPLLGVVSCRQRARGDPSTCYLIPVRTFSVYFSSLSQLLQVSILISYIPPVFSETAPPWNSPVGE